jgi:hypothetical protein
MGVPTRSTWLQLATSSCDHQGTRPPHHEQVASPEGDLHVGMQVGYLGVFYAAGVIPVLMAGVAL